MHVENWASGDMATIMSGHFITQQQNTRSFIERYNCTVRHEWLSQYIIENIDEAQNFATKRLWTYNNN